MVLWWGLISSLSAEGMAYDSQANLVELTKHAYRDARQHQRGRADMTGAANAVLNSALVAGPAVSSRPDPRTNYAIANCSAHAPSSG